MSAPTAYPLSWPKAKARTRSRKGGQFKVSLYGAVGRVETELARIKATGAVISSNQAPLTGKSPDDPGVAVYFQLKERPTVLACDRYDSVTANLAAIAAHIEATRACERHGVATLEEMFAGFAALSGGMAPADWRAVLNEPQSLDQAERAYRHLAKARHPDSGGSTAKMAELNAAIAMARTVLK